MVDCIFPSKLSPTTTPPSRRARATWSELLAKVASKDHFSTKDETLGTTLPSLVEHTIPHSRGKLTTELSSHQKVVRDTRSLHDNSLPGDSHIDLNQSQALDGKYSDPDLSHKLVDTNQSKTYDGFSKSYERLSDLPKQSHEISKEFPKFSQEHLAFPQVLSEHDEVPIEFHKKPSECSESSHRLTEKSSELTRKSPELFDRNFVINEGPSEVDTEQEECEPQLSITLNKSQAFELLQKINLAKKFREVAGIQRDQEISRSCLRRRKYTSILEEKQIQRPWWWSQVEVLWLMGHFKQFRFTDGGPAQLQGNVGRRIWANYKLQEQRKLDCLKGRKDAIKHGWSSLIEMQKKRDYLDYLQNHPDPRIPSFKKPIMHTHPKALVKSKPSVKKCQPSLFYGGEGGSGMLPVLVLAPREGDTVLDLCAAQGHHSLLLALTMNNIGVLISNTLTKDPHPQYSNHHTEPTDTEPTDTEPKLLPLPSLLQRFGVSFSIVTHLDLSDFPQVR